MKKFFSLFAAALLFSGFFMPSNLWAGVEGGFIDQSNEAVDQMAGGLPFDFEMNPYLIQTFVPTSTKITSVDLYLTNQLPGRRLNVKLVKFDGTVASPFKASVPFPMNQNGWVSISYNEPFVSVEPGKEYWLFASITGDSQTKWGYTDGNLYKDGEVTGWQNHDFLFIVNGQKIVNTPGAPVSNPIVTPVSNPLPAEKVAVDESIKEPIITHVMKEKIKVDAPFKKEMAVGKTADLTLYGTSFVGAKVAIFVAEKGYEATVDASGNWSYKLDLSKLENKTYTVTAQAQNSAGKGSAISEMMKVKIISPVGSGTAGNLTGWFVGWNIFYVLILVGLLLLVLLLLALIARRHHLESEKGDVKKIANEPELEPEVKEPKIKK